MIDKSITTLSQLVSKFEENELELTQVPHEFVDRYGYACLANSLMFKEPNIPKYNIKIAEHIKSTKFSTLTTLTSYINKLQNDIDKLFAIFSYAALNIEYDVKLCFSGETRKTTLEEVFKTKKAVCSGYAIFFEGMANKVGIDSKRINIKGYSNFSKALSYDPLNKPKKIRSNHASIYITIDNVPFISEPTWASGQLTKSKDFERNFRPNMFLIPLYKSLCDHFPCDESHDLLTINFPFSHFFQSIKVDPFGRQVKTESNPFVNITSSTGYIEQIYSCIGPVESVSINLSIQSEDRFYEISSDGLTSYEIMQTKLPKHPDRCRFKTYILFPEVGFFKVEMLIDGKIVLSYFVDNLKKSSGSIPIQYNPFHKTKFIAIKPKNIHCDVETGAIIRFAVSKYHSNIRLKIFKFENDNSFNEIGKLIDPSYGKYIKLEIPFDKERYEIQLCVIFPSNGRYSVSIFLESLKGSFVFYVKYFFDVTGVDPEKAYKDHPIYYMCKGRNFAPIKIYDKKHEVIVKPNQSCYVVNKREQTLQFKTSSIDDKLYFEFKKNGKTVVWPKIVGNDGQFQKISFTIPEEFGEYWLKGWVNDNCCINLYYMYQDIVFKETTAEERRLLDLLKRRVNGEKYNSGQVLNEVIQNKRRKSNKSLQTKKNDNTGSMSPKSCLSENTDNESKHNEIEELTKLIENLKIENEKIKIENQDLNTEISKVKKENEELKMNKNQIVDDKYEKINQENGNLLNDDNKKQIREVNEYSQNDIDKLKIGNEKLILENNSLIQKNEELANQNIILKQEINKFNSDDNKLRIVIDDQTKVEMEQLKRKIDDLQKNNDKIPKENEILNLENDKIHEINDEKTNELIENLKKENEKLRNENKNCLIEIGKLKDDNEKIIVENNKKLQIIKEEKTKIEKSNEENEKLKNDIAKLNEEKKKYLDEIESLKKEIEKINNKYKLHSINDEMLVNLTHNNNKKRIDKLQQKANDEQLKADEKINLSAPNTSTPKSVNEKTKPQLSSTSTLNKKEKQKFSNSLTPKSLSKIIETKATKISKETNEKGKANDTKTSTSKQENEKAKSFNITTQKSKDCHSDIEISNEKKFSKTLPRPEIPIINTKKFDSESPKSMKTVSKLSNTTPKSKDIKINSEDKPTPKKTTSQNTKTQNSSISPNKESKKSKSTIAIKSSEIKTKENNAIRPISKGNKSNAILSNSLDQKAIKCRKTDEKENIIPDINSKISTNVRPKPKIINSSSIKTENLNHKTPKKKKPISRVLNTPI